MNAPYRSHLHRVGSTALICWAMMIGGYFSSIQAFDWNQMISDCSNISTGVSGEISRESCIDLLFSWLVLLEPGDARADIVRGIIETIPESDLSPVLLANKAGDLLQNGKPAQAAEKYLDLILKFPKDENINRWRIALARAFRDSGNFKQAKEQLALIASGGSIDASWALLEQARLHYALDEIGESERLYRAIETRSTDKLLRSIVQSELKKLNLKKLAEVDR